MEGGKRRDVRPENDGNALVAILFGLFLGTILVGLLAAGEGDWSEAMAWGIASLVLLKWVSLEER